jgi:hypothetical protein
LLETGLPLFARETFFQWQYSPFTAGWQFIGPDSLDVVWAWGGQWQWGLLAVLLTNVVVTAVLLWRASRPPTQPSHRSLLPVALLAGATALVSQLLYAHQITPPGVKMAASTLNVYLRSGDAVITNEPETTMSFAEQYRATAPVLGLNNGGYPLPDDVAQRLNNVISAHNHIWWLPNWLPPAESAIEQTLQAGMVQVRQFEFGAQRLVLFARPADGPPQPINQTFNQTITLTKARLPEQITAGSPLALELQWQASAIPDADYHVFVHLVNEAGQTVAQSDGQPAQWQRPTTTWQVGEEIIDPHGLWLPEDVVANTLIVRVGLYNPTTGERLRLVGEADAVEISLSVEAE